MRTYLPEQFLSHGSLTCAVNLWNYQIGSDALTREPSIVGASVTAVHLSLLGVVSKILTVHMHSGKHHPR
jgi:hypothetical protein